MKEVKSIYRILAQTETVTMNATTSKELTEKEAREVGEKEVLAYHDKTIYQRFVAIPLCTKHQWEDGNVNFCPRCGERLAELNDDHADNWFDGECPQCEAQLEINIHVYSED